MNWFTDLRETLAWYPILDAELCRQDLECLNSCPCDVFEWDAGTGNPFVAHPLRCQLGCQICVEVCTTGALSQPGKTEIHQRPEEIRNQQHDRTSIQSASKKKSR